MSSPEISKCLFILSGEHPTLPKAELCAILESEGYSYSIKRHDKRLLIIDVNQTGALRVVLRAGLVNHASVVAAEMPSREDMILDSLQSLDFTQWIQPNTRFGVKITRLKREPTKLDVDDLQSKVGSIIWEAMSGTVEVALESPDLWFLGVINENQFYFGPHLASRSRKAFSARRSPLRPFFVPSAIHPKIARVLVNLSRARPGSYVVDPFCGTGGLLLEAAEIGCIPVAFDIDSIMVSGSKQNLSHYRIPFFGGLADARAPSIRNANVEAIATDPPYGRSSSTKGAAVKELIRVSLSSLSSILKPGGHLSLALPKEHFNQDMIPANSFLIKEMHTMRIHRSLYRHIVVLERK
ncbi:MAG: THUMP domain-containing protein [Promethearchaeota archaeon]